MLKKHLKFAIFVSFFLLTSFFLLRKLTTQVKSATTHVVISEVQIGGITATDEFVELYNPTSSPVDMEGWRLTRKTSSGSQSNLVSSISGIVPAYGYFLIAHPNYDGTTTPDLLYSATSNSITGHNSVILYNDAGVTEVDKVGMGAAIDFEDAPTGTPQPSTSTERKALNSSTVVSMATGGSDELLGNGEDTDNNYNDFLARDIPQPQNTSSSTESSGSAPSPTPTTEPTQTPTPTPDPTITPTPTPGTTPVLLISEVQIAGASSTDEFVELYNPTSEAININGWKLTRKNSGGTENNLVSNLPDVAIQPYGYYLVTHLNYVGAPSADTNYSNSSYSLSSNAVVLLYSDTDELVDKVGMGTATDFETTATMVPGADESVERKANASSTFSSMSAGGADENSGNSYDTDNNENDFVYRTLPNPQNSSSPTESTGTSPTPTPTAEPTPTPEPTETPTPGEPTPTPTVQPTPTPTPQPTPTGRVIARFVFPGRITTCTLNYRFVRFGFFRAFFPYITCTRS